MIDRISSIFHVIMLATYRVEVSSSLPPHSDKCVFPESVLQDVLTHEFPHPIVIKLQFESKSIYVGVKEFSAEEGSILVPLDVASKLGDAVSMEVVRLPKAKFLTLKPRQFYTHITDWKYYLEAHLSKSYTVLCRKQIVKIADPLVPEPVEFTIEKLSDEASIVIDTDIDLDVTPLNDIMAHQQLNSFETNRVFELNAINEMKAETFTKGPLRVYSLTLKAGTVDIKLSSENDHNVDVVIGLDRFVSMENFRWSLMDQVGEKIVRVEAHGANSHLIVYLVIFAWETPETVIVEVLDANAGDSRSCQSRCTNCRQFVDNEKLTLHESFCKRHNVRCECGAVFRGAVSNTHWHCELCGLSVHGESRLAHSRHFQLMHSGPYSCKSCDERQNFDTFFELVTKHKNKDCAAKLHECQFCHLVLPQGKADYMDNYSNLTHHETECGNRTGICDQCSKTCKMKDMASHAKMHYLAKKRLNDVRFERCRNSNCVNELHLSNDLKLCERCFSPLFSTVHDPTKTRLLGRIERRYMLQLTRGCGNSWCENRECVTGNKERKGWAMRDIIEYLNSELLSQACFTKPDKPFAFWFCVDESVQRRRELALVLIHEEMFEENMVLKAINAQATELSVRHWLHQHAIAR